MRNPRILALAQAAADATTIAAAAAAMGISRPYLSRYLNDDLEGVEQIEAKIALYYDRRLCPHTGGGDHPGRMSAQSAGAGTVRRRRAPGAMDNLSNLQS